MKKLNKIKVTIVSVFALSLLANGLLYTQLQTLNSKVNNHKYSMRLKDDHIDTLENQMLIANEEINNLRTQIELKEFEQPKNSDSE